ncbi:CCR4-NOT transcription complex subunit 3 [Zostera marina]|uniref:CCR4-NOT transcription complex subunit 3 n=1 Tax=Zostera marina TaxID=29655 RepID=A0A0K9P581_ZOSMR|nr:CCR4-NOT transcription complex subunit 3 [Zostera marina]
MGASRKLQGEIDRVLKKVMEGVDVFDSIWNKVYDTENLNQKEKFEADLKKEIKKLQRYRDQIKTWIQSSEIKDKKVSASYEQALMDARKQIEREMERFKICEKETKTKAFSKEGLGQQPKPDPKEKAKSETRDWLNNVVGDLESQIEHFEAEIEAVSVKKGKPRPPRLIHLETSIARHKAHIMKLELILRLLDNDELSPEQVNDVKDFLDDYVERNQDCFDEFSDVDDFYCTLPLEKDLLEDLVANSPVLVKDVLVPPSQPSNATQDQSEAATQDSNSDVVRILPKNGTPGSLISSSTSIDSGIIGGASLTAPGNLTSHNLVGESTTVITSPIDIRSLENPVATDSSFIKHSSSVRNDDTTNFHSRRSSPAPNEIAGRGIGLASNQSSISAMDLGSVGVISGTGSFGVISDTANRISVSDEKTETGKSLTNFADTANVGEGSITGGRVFSPSVMTNAQWRPQNLNTYQSQNESGQNRGRAEVVPDQREKFLQRYQVSQQQHQSATNLLSTGHISGVNQKQFIAQQQNSSMQQTKCDSGQKVKDDDAESDSDQMSVEFNNQNSPQVTIGLGGQPSIIGNAKPALQQQQPNLTLSQHSPQGSFSRDSDLGHVKIEGQMQIISSDDLNAEPPTSSVSGKAVTSDDDLKSSYMTVPRDTDLPSGQPLQSNQSSSSHGVIGRRSMSDHGTIGDTFSGSFGNSSTMDDGAYQLQMLDAAIHKLPQANDSERVKNYIPRRPAMTPSSYPQTQAPIVDNPAFWERLGLDNMGADTLFFSFYYQQNTYQQYLAAKELKRQSWRYHRKYNTWFQRHEEPKVTTDDYEQGTYVYFDFHIADDNMQQHGWCQRIKTDFTFEYSFLEDELAV